MQKKTTRRHLSGGLLAAAFVSSALLCTAPKGYADSQDGSSAMPPVIGIFTMAGKVAGYKAALADKFPYADYNSCLRGYEGLLSAGEIASNDSAPYPAVCYRPSNGEVRVIQANGDGTFTLLPPAN